MVLLEVKDLEKSFGGVKATNKVSFQVNKGEIVGLIGPNGAGKTTLFNLISGFYKTDAGDIRLNEESIVGYDSCTICKKGIGRTFQTAKPFHGLTVFQNVMLGLHFGSILKRVNSKDRREKCLDILRFMKLYHKRDSLGRDLTIAEQKSLEMTRAWATRPELLLLDEVMAGLNPVEIEETCELVRKIRESGTTILIIEHVMKAIMSLSDRIIVLKTGEKIAEGKPVEIANDKAVISAYLGEISIA